MTLMKRDAGERVIRKRDDDDDDDDLEPEIDAAALVAEVTALQEAAARYLNRLQGYMLQGNMTLDEAERLARTMEPAGYEAYRQLFPEGEPRAKPEDDEEDDDMDAEKQLEKMAKEHAAKHNVTFEKAYSTVLETPEGSALYAKYCQEPRPAVAKAKPAPEYDRTAAEIRLDDLAKRHADARGISFHKAYAEVIETPDGARAYDVYLAETAKRAAA